MDSAWEKLVYIPLSKIWIVRNKSTSIKHLSSPYSLAQLHSFIPSPLRPPHQSSSGKDGKWELWSVHNISSLLLLPPHTFIQSWLDYPQAAEKFPSTMELLLLFRLWSYFCSFSLFLFQPQFSPWHFYPFLNMF